LIQKDLRNRIETGLKLKGTYLSHLELACTTCHVKVALQVESDGEAAVVEHVEEKKETNRLCIFVHNDRKLLGAKIEFSRSSLVQCTGTCLSVSFPEGRAVHPAVASAGGVTMCHNVSHGLAMPGLCFPWLSIVFPCLLIIIMH
jgi:hypothetical protein